ncbi:MAG TPA: serine/threonine-protein kinase [Phycisphaerae bacterium]|nr:serine/threonine-protein kinase [Phycisphaerae bacterium]
MTDDAPNVSNLQGEVIAARYRLDRFLDEGAFGAVYRATHLAYGIALRDVAIKIAKRPMSDLEARSTFGDAIRLCGLIDAAPDAETQQHFVMVHDAGRCGQGELLADHPYFAMELVRGGSLARSLRLGPFPLTRAIDYFDQILKAVAFMHGGSTGPGEKAEPVVHRDLKPENLRVVRRRDGRDVVKVSDFGLAVEVDTRLGWVASGGDLAYLAPESFSHDISSPQTDVYALGLVFYEMISQRGPFRSVGAHLRGSDEEKRHELRRLHYDARQHEEFRLLESHEELRRQPRLARVIRTALAVDMKDRTYANACELLAAWEEAKRGNGPPPPPPTEHPWQTVRRKTDAAEQFFSVGNDCQGDALLKQALEINRDVSRVPDSMCVGKCYLLAVDRLLEKGQIEEAGTLANEGYRRRKCRSTRRAMSHYYRDTGSPLAARFEQEAQSCPDQE